MNKHSVSIIGCGKVGSALAIELSSKGYHIAHLCSRDIRKSEALSNLIPSSTYSSGIEREAIESADIILICIPDQSITDAARNIASLNVSLSGKIFLHTSGSETSAVLTETGASREFCASMHPIQTFMTESRENLNLLSGIYFGIEGGSEAVNVSQLMVENLGSKFLMIPEDRKQLYHTACVVSSNFLVTLFNVAAEFSASVGIDKSDMFNVFKPIIERTIANVSDNGLTQSLTGPFERNDVKTISNHLNSISDELPSLIPFYTLLGMETVKVAFRKESLNMKNVLSILDLLNDYVAKESKSVSKFDEE